MHYFLISVPYIFYYLINYYQKIKKKKKNSIKNHKINGNKKLNNQHFQNKLNKITIIKFFKNIHLKKK
jgi:uncharacterized ion transporter superfamily protein YfcC